ncbi:MAG: hypothetical protein KDA53_03845 [Hyphomonas sp.]|nr:hypothetical protein [Hyphomonas sp.]
MKRCLLALSVLLAAGHASTALPQEETDEIVRLPGQGFTKPEARKARGTPERLVPGGGLFLSFDADQDGRITTAELRAGTLAAFLTADTNEDGFLTAFEQISWAESLPTRDDTLTNPVRFDPNLDRSVSAEEFEAVITELAAHYAEAGTGDILVSDLKAKAPKRKDRADLAMPRIRATSKTSSGGS